MKRKLLALCILILASANTHSVKKAGDFSFWKSGKGAIQVLPDPYWNNTGQTRQTQATENHDYSHFLLEFTRQNNLFITQGDTLNQLFISAIPFAGNFNLYRTVQISIPEEHAFLFASFLESLPDAAEHRNDMRFVGFGQQPSRMIPERPITPCFRGNENIRFTNNQYDAQVAQRNESRERDIAIRSLFISRSVTTRILHYLQGGELVEPDFLTENLHPETFVTPEPISRRSTSTFTFGAGAFSAGPSQFSSFHPHQTTARQNENNPNIRTITEGSIENNFNPIPTSAATVELNITPLSHDYWFIEEIPTNRAGVEQLLFRLHTPQTTARQNENNPNIRTITEGSIENDFEPIPTSAETVELNTTPLSNGRFIERTPNRAGVEQPCLEPPQMSH